MEDGEKAKSHRGSGVSMPIFNRNARNYPMEKGFGPDLQYPMGYNNPYMMPSSGGYPILVNPPPMPTVISMIIKHSNIIK